MELENKFVMNKASSAFIQLTNVIGEKQKLNTKVALMYLIFTGLGIIQELMLHIYSKIRVI